MFCIFLFIFYIYSTNFVTAKCNLFIHSQYYYDFPVCGKIGIYADFSNGTLKLCH